MILIDGIPLNVTKFPDNTSQVWNLAPEILNQRKTVVRWEFESEQEFMYLAQLKDLLDENEVISTLILPYLPYGRQDKIISNETTFALRTFAKLLNSLNFDRVDIYDPHNLIAFNLICNSEHWLPDPDISHTLSKFRPDYLCYPDKGAAEKYSGRFHGTPYFCAKKMRDQFNGKIMGLELINPPNVSGFDILIIDDICDGGATFIGLAKILKTNGAKNIGLHVSHGLFTKGIKILIESGINRIFTRQGEINDTST